MQYTYLLMLVASTVSAGPIGLRSSTPGFQSIARGLPPSTSPYAPGESLSDTPLRLVANMQCHFVAPGSSTPSNNPPTPNLQAPLIDTNNPSKTSAASTIPAAAWPQISTILSTITTTMQNTMQTWDLGRALNDDTLEGVMLGVVYSAKSTPEGSSSASPDAREKIKGRGEQSTKTGSKVEITGLASGFQIEESERWRRECVQSAVLEVESKRLMEGALEMPRDDQGNGGGRASFLVYRVD